MEDIPREHRVVVVFREVLREAHLAAICMIIVTREDE